MIQRDFETRKPYPVLDPRGIEPKRSSFLLSPRIPDLTDKVIYCVSQHIAGADSLLQKLAEVLPRYAPRVNAVYKRRSSAYMTDDSELWDEIVEKADGVIYGCGA